MTCMLRFGGSRRGRRLLATALILAALFVAPAPRAAAQTGGALAPEADAAGTVRVLRSDGSGVLLELHAPEPRLEAGQGETAGYDRVLVPGFEPGGAPGAPELPLRQVLVGVPAAAEVELRLLSSAQAALPGRHRIVPAPAWELRAEKAALDDWEAMAGGSTLERILAEDPAVYGAAAAYPASPVRLVEVGQIRHQRVAQVEFCPVQVHPLSGEVLYTARALVELLFVDAAGAPRADAGPAGEEPAPFEAFLRESLVNYESARRWRAEPAPARAAAAGLAQAAGSPDPGLRVAVAVTGLYRITRADLLAAGLPAAALDQMDPRTLRILYHDQEVAIQVEGEADGHFDEGDALLFYGEAIGGKYAKYARENVYWLTYDPAGADLGRRMASVSGALNGAAVPASFAEPAHFETNAAYWSKLPGHEEDDDYARWYWTAVAAGGEKVLTAVLPGVAPGAGTAAITIAMGGFTDLPADPEHHLAVYVNDNPVAELEWDGIAAYTGAFSFSQAYLQEGDNQVRFQGLVNTGAENSSSRLDWFEITYNRLYRAAGDVLAYGTEAAAGGWEVWVDGFSSSEVETYDVTDPYDVARVTTPLPEAGASGYRLKLGDPAGGRRFWSQLPAQRRTPSRIVVDTPSSLRSAANGADYVMITHSDFAADLQPLAAYYHRPPPDPDPFEVRVVDVQDVYDEFSGGILYPGAIRAFLAYALANWNPAPSYVLLVGDGHVDYTRNLALTDLGQYLPPYLAVVDPWLGEATSDNRYACVSGDDAWPDLIVGRFPVNNRAEMQAMAAKTLAYQQSPAAGDWNGRILFVADDPDEGGEFRDLVDGAISGSLPAPYQAAAQKVYYGLAPYTDAATTRAAIAAAMAEGRLLVSYTGHSAIPWWAAERFFHFSDVAGLAESERWPIMLAMTCLEGQFSFMWSRVPSLSETLVRAAGKGAVAAWSATGQGLAAGHDYLHKGFLEAVFYDGVRRLGDATLAGKLRLWASGANRDLIDTYVLLGDPALRINALDADLQVEKRVEPAGEVHPGDLLTYTLTFTNSGPATAHGVVLSDPLSATLVEAEIVYESPAVAGRVAGERLAWELQDLAPGAGGEIRFRARVDPQAEVGILWNAAEIQAAEPEISPSDNTDSVFNTVGEVLLPDLQVEKRVEPAGEVHPGDLLTYTLTFTNAGPATAHGVVLSDPLSATLVEAEIVYESPEVAGRVAGERLAWELQDLAPGAGGEIRFRARVDPQAGPGTLSNAAAIQAAEPELDLSDNTASVSNSVIEVLRPDLYVAKTGPASLRPGQSLVYTISWGNLAPAAASGVRITDRLPAGTIYVKDDSGLALSQPEPGVLVWTVPPDGVGGLHADSFRLTLWLRPEIVSGTLINRIAIGATPPDQNPADNESTWMTVVMPSSGRTYLPLILKQGP